MEEEKKKKYKEWFKRFWKYVIKTTNGMAQGLFATLIIGTILSTVGRLIPQEFFALTGGEKPLYLYDAFQNIATTLKGLMGVGIGIGVGLSLSLTPIQCLSAGIAGAIGTTICPGNPLMAYVCSIAGIEITRRLVLRKKTPVDMILIPLLVSLFSFIIGWLLKYPVDWMINGLASVIDTATEAQPFIMGIVISVLMGMALTAPISSVAIATAISLSGIAGGAAVVGCSVQMVGFAVMTAMEKGNGIGKTISVGIGTSMLQFKNILKNPLIWIPTILVSAILGPIATCWLHMETSVAGAGMGTSGLVGQIGTIDAMGWTTESILGISLLHILLPILLVFGLTLLFKKLKWIHQGDLLL